MTLDEIQPGGVVRIKRCYATGLVAQRMLDMGFFKGAVVEVLRNAPLVDPVEFVLDGAHVSLRHEEAKLLEVVQ